MRALLKEYLILVAQLETQFLRGNMSVQKMLLYIQVRQLDSVGGGGFGVGKG